MTSIETEIVPKIRRAIDDTEKPYLYEDTALMEYVEDSVEALSIEWEHGYLVDREMHTIEPEVSKMHQMVFVLKTKYDLLAGQSDISFDTGHISITRKNENKKSLKNKLDSILTDLKLNDNLGYSITELDD